MMERPDKEGKRPDDRLSPFSFLLSSSPMRLRQLNRIALMGWIIPLALILAASVLGALHGGRTGSDIPWLDDYGQALRLARQTHRPLLLQFHTAGCVWCAKMEAETFADADVIELSRRFVCVSIDDATDGAACARYGVLEFPTTIFADAQGRMTGRLTGYIPPVRFAQAERPPSTPSHLP